MTIIIGVGGCVAYFYFSNQFLDKVLLPAKGANAGRNINRANLIRPWLFLFPAIFALGLYLAYPVVATLWYSVTDRNQGGAFVGFANYQRMMAEPKFWEALRNNMLWLIIVPAASTAFGLLAAQLTDRIKWGAFAKSLIFMPMAISFVGASVIFKLIYDTRPVDQNQIGALNALWLQFDGGIGSFLILRLLPGALMICAAVLALFVAYTNAQTIREKGASAGSVLRTARGSLRPARNRRSSPGLRSSPLATPSTVTACSPSSENTSQAIASCPLPPSISTRSGNMPSPAASLR